MPKQRDIFMNGMQRLHISFSLLFYLTSAKRLLMRLIIFMWHTNAFRKAFYLIKCIYVIDKAACDDLQIFFVILYVVFCRLFHCSFHWVKQPGERGHRDLVEYFSRKFMIIEEKPTNKICPSTYPIKYIVWMHIIW